ncbi:MAG: type II CRISPR RNA-guided endonuclease Cas9 [Bacteroidales bacterium]|nr:type II CRISPR RNA-guided endonuclease Cas9 [Bacteroidales bacterium]MDD2264903.1 type II CRISPR RNA-guided endonuclease Cas9 [Bacteroidales bacterium]MDD2832279.1 type II CRISPR RNA-guided endonuclease Cas9 [Bacteroidales bacterium]MDD4473589.1 type II CRISPR RNA-guided endonuclease Cas9 [Bacteroidales bacterium]MDD5047175.1 type II CRISPR RNA-guided endonuclease Cas9 [Bacteroidales bacterium]
MKRVLGLDLGTNSIGWAIVNEAENQQEKSAIIRLGVRVNPLTIDEQQNFEKGKSITTNADRTLKRSMRRNLQRYKLRRDNLIEILKKSNIISDDTILSENGPRSTFETYQLRAKAATEEITLEQFSRVLLMINKKRGYKSSRKSNSSEDGTLIDGMEVAKQLYNENLTPGELCLKLINEGKKNLPDFYNSDLQAEFNKIWQKQTTFYPGMLTTDLKDKLFGKNEKVTWTICKDQFKWEETERIWNNTESKNEDISVQKTLVGLKRNGNKQEQKIENFVWRSKALYEKLHPEEIAIVLSKINAQIYGSSGYLGLISDRSKELCFNKKYVIGYENLPPHKQTRPQTVGEYKMAVLANNPHASLRNMVFFRQDYLDEYNVLWETQAKFHKELNDDLKREIRDVIIFYQRRLKSQKGLISFCEFESKKEEIEIDGKKKIKTIGSRVIPRSSPLFQEFRIWQVLNNVEVSTKDRINKKRKDKASSLFEEQEDKLKIYGKRELYQEEKELLALELSLKEKLTKGEVLKLLFDKPQELDLNFAFIPGNTTQARLFEAYKNIVEQTGHNLNLKNQAFQIIQDVEKIFTGLGYNTQILHFDSSKPLDEQPMYKLWHLLYSYEGDDSTTGQEKLISQITHKYGFEKEFANEIAKIVFQDDYGSLSAKAIRKILPYLKEGNKYDVACLYAGYRHSASSLTKEEIEKKLFKDKLDVLPKNSLRNPVVEKILNQMVNVVNAIIDTYGKPDEIRIELARELKKSAKEREDLSKFIAETTKVHEEYRRILTKPLSEGGQFGLVYVNRNDIIRYKLYEELKDNGYKTLYSNTYISPGSLFSGDFDIEHIIPQSRLFDDSFSNKTLELRAINLEKGNKTAYDFIKEKYGEQGEDNSLENYLKRISVLYNKGVLSHVKYNKLIMQEAKIPEGFINRDLGDTRYITKYAKTMLGDLVKRVVTTTGSITDVLRNDWQLVDVMKELNWDKYDRLGLTYYETNNEGKQLKRIKNWTKRNDHRHHAMDALTVAFTKDAYVQYFNNKNASFNTSSNEYALKTKYFENNRAIPPIPLDEFRAQAKRHLKNTLVSIKAKNKVITQNVNTTQKYGGVNKKIQQTPRGQLHLETIFGSIRQYVTKDEKVGPSFDEDKIKTVSKQIYRTALWKRLQEYDNNPQNAFGGKNSPIKNPIYIDKEQTVTLPEKVKTVTYKTIYTIRKEISPDLSIEKVVDLKIRKILEDRLKEYENDPRKAFLNIEKKPIWLNKDKDISIKRVTISGITNAENLHEKRDKNGIFLLDNEGNKQPVDYVNTGNNHHVAVYRDSEGNIQENVVSFFEAVARRNLGLPIIDKAYKEKDGWQFLFSMKQNEYFVFPNELTGFFPNEVDLLNPDNYSLISPYLFRVQKISFKNYVFRHHLETSIKDTTSNTRNITWTDFRSSKGLDKIVKVRINHIGQIVSIGEY